MRVILTGGGSGGHFYPLIAVARSLKSITESRRIPGLELIYSSSEPYDAELLREENIKFLKIPAGKIRRYFSLKNLIDPFRTFFGIIKGVWVIYLHYPDVIFAKGGYASFPTLFVAKILRIPVVVHETDTIPGKVTLWASKFAKRIAISFPESAKYFPQNKIALTGNPVRKELLMGTAERAQEVFNLEPGVPVILILGGSQGSQKINDSILDILKGLLEFSQVIHQTGENNFKGVELRAGIVLEGSSFSGRYHPEAFLDEEKMRDAFAAASVIVMRPGGSVFEVAAKGIPAILIPLPSSAQDHQRENAYAYARAGAADVLEEQNLTPHLFLGRIKSLLEDDARKAKMIEAAKAFSKPDAADKIADEIIRLTIAHGN